MTVDIEACAPFQPRPTPSSAGYWERLAQGEVCARRCLECGLWMHPPLLCCRRCGGETSFQRLVGNGTVYSFTVTHYPVAPMYQSPFVVAVVTMDEQDDLRMVGRVVGTSIAAVKVGMRVTAEIDDLPGGDFKVVAFLPSGAPDAGAGA